PGVRRILSTFAGRSRCKKPCAGSTRSRSSSSKPTNRARASRRSPWRTSSAGSDSCSLRHPPSFRRPADSAISAASRAARSPPERGRLLWVIGDKSVRAGLVAQQLKLSAGAVTELVERLVDEGLVRRDTDPDDRRAVVLALTAEGRRVCDRYELAASSELAQVL